MPPLENQRHERFAQELAKGKTADEAYVAAGYKEHRGNASTLRTKKNISERVEELKDRGAKRAEITIELLIGYLDEARVLAASTKQPAAIVAAVKEMGILSGKRVEKHENTNRNVNELSDDDLADIASAGRRDAAAPQKASPRPH